LYSRTVVVSMLTPERDASFTLTIKAISTS